MTNIYDVARAAGVSPKTVSRVINGDPAVREPTRESVQMAIAELGYVPSSAARAMRSNKSGLIGLITGAISHAPPDDGRTGLPDLYIVQGIQRALENSAMTLLISDTGGRSEAVPKLLRTFAEHRVEGVLYVADYHRKVSLPRGIGMPVVLANCYDDRDTPSVLPHDLQCQKALVKRLIGAGHRRIAYLTLSPELDATPLRISGYRAALESAGIAYDPALVVTADVPRDDNKSEMQLLWDAIDRVMSMDVSPTVLCCGNDRMAIRAYTMLRDRGLTIPGDVSVAGFDNYRPIAETLSPGLTTVELPYAAMGIRAAEQLLGMVRGTSTPPAAPVLVGGPVSWRDSVATLPASVTTITSIGRKTT
ncbi:LacI family DNA-binding transcriptional regulator [Roseisalinus antarcticus]|uniref:Catabolite control protein A n=1 Tax=Roseisalinus antarcticus TaxID=254357 RepID=A0A1Y5S0Q5_9RHOB|nr:LacI family DNA-binding transcriptional regulator [Roseisalinus antarcticus]SLN28559.1 Catabolite control protein A [Roseisalinus antarcticus]